MRDFWSFILPYIISKHGDSETAYDTDFFEFIMDLNNYLIVGCIIHNFLFTEVILNYYTLEYSVTQLNEIEKNSYFVHSGKPLDW